MIFRSFCGFISQFLWFATVSNEQFFAKPDIEFMRLKEVLKLFGVSRASFDRWQNPKSEYYRPDFPKKIVMGGYVFYVREEVRAYMQKLIDER